MCMFLVYYLLFLIGTPCLYNFLWKAIQQDQMLGKWQDVLAWLYEQGYKNLEKFLGGCELCFSHFVSWLSLAIFCGLLYRIWPFAWYETIVVLLYPLVTNWFTGLWMKQSMDIRNLKRQKLQDEEDDREAQNRINNA